MQVSKMETLLGDQMQEFRKWSCKFIVAGITMKEQ